MLSSTGPPRLALILCLQGRWDTCLAMLATQCSAWIGVNSGTHKRTVLTPRGDITQPSVSRSNKQVARTATGVVVENKIWFWNPCELQDGFGDFDPEPHEHCLAHRKPRIYAYVCLPDPPGSHSPIAGCWHQGRLACGKLCVARVFLEALLWTNSFLSP